VKALTRTLVKSFQIFSPDAPYSKARAAPSHGDDYLNSDGSLASFLVSGYRRPRLTSLLTEDGVKFNRSAT
jgi:hypothetical protein